MGCDITLYLGCLIYVRRPPNGQEAIVDKEVEMSEGEKTFIIRFQDVSLAEAGSKADRLRNEILDASSEVEVIVEKDDPNTQDFGSILVLVLGTPAIIVIAKGIADFLRRERATIEIESNGRVIAKGIRGGDAARIAEAMSHRT
jgi:hypothetical protein